MSILFKKRAVSRLVWLSASFLCGSGFVSGPLLSSDGTSAASSAWPEMGRLRVPHGDGDSTVPAGSPVPAARAQRSGSASSGGSTASRKGEVAAYSSPRIDAASWQYLHLCGRVLISDSLIERNLSNFAGVVPVIEVVNMTAGLMLKRAMACDVGVPGVKLLEDSVSSGPLKFEERVLFLAQGAIMFSAYLTSLVADESRDYPLTHVAGHLAAVGCTKAASCGVPHIPSAIKEPLQLAVVGLLAQYQPRLMAAASFTDHHEFAIAFINACVSLVVSGAVDTFIDEIVASRATLASTPHQINAVALIALYGGCRMHEIHVKLLKTQETIRQTCGLMGAVTVDPEVVASQAAKHVYGDLPENGYY